MTQSSLQLVGLCAIVVSGLGCDIDGGFSIDSEVSFEGVGDLSHAPVFVQGYLPPDVDADGSIRAGARPHYQLLTSGSMRDGQPVPLSYGSLGYPSEVLFVAWIDLDGDAAIGWQGGDGAAARPGPGDIVGGPAQARFVSAEGTSSSYAEFGDPLVFSEVSVVSGDVSPMVRIELDTHFSMLDVPDDVELPLVFQAQAYRLQDFVAGRPCASCQPLFTFDESRAVTTGGRNVFRFSAERYAEPSQVWLSGASGGRVVFAGAAPAIYGGEDATRSRAAIGLAVELAPLL